MKFITPAAEDLSYLRADPLLWEQELDVRPEVAEGIERTTGLRAGRVYWRSAHDHLYALELADLGRGHPSMATVYGYWDRYEPRPPEHEIDGDLLAFSLWVAAVGGLDPVDVARVAERAGITAPRTDGTPSHQRLAGSAAADRALVASGPGWPQGSVLRTPEERFEALPDFSYEPRFVEIEGLRMAFVEEGDGDPILMLHGEPTWGYLYRWMIPPLATVGRVIAPDLIGFGRSDKPVADNAYSYKAHVRWLRGFVEKLDLRRVTLVCQDWGGLLGLRLLAQMPERFGRLVAMNTGIPDGRDPGEPFLRWRRFTQQQRELDLPAMMRRAVLRRGLSDAEAAAYGAPFPSAEYQTGALVFPRLVPVRPDHPGAYENRVAIERLKTFDLPVLLIWSDSDPITGPWEPHLRAIFRNVAPPVTIEGAGHFIQEDAGPEVADRIRAWLGRQ